jgi:hypothetical protein
LLYFLPNNQKKKRRKTFRVLTGTEVIAIVWPRAADGVEVGAKVAVGISVGSSVGTRVGRRVSTKVGTLVATGIAMGTAVGWGADALPHMTMDAYEQDEPVQPSLQMTRPLPWGPASQLTPLWPEQQPEVALID